MSVTPPQSEGKTTDEPRTLEQAPPSEWVLLDPRLELMGVLLSLAGIPEVVNSRHVEEVRRRFEGWESHEAVRKTAAFAGEPGGVATLIRFFMSLSTPPSLEIVHSSRNAAQRNSTHSAGSIRLLWGPTCLGP